MHTSNLRFLLSFLVSLFLVCYLAACRHRKFRILSASHSISSVAFPCAIPALSRSFTLPADVATDNEYQYNLLSPEAASRLAVSFAATVMLAMDHFNARDASVVPEVEQVPPNCNITFPDPIFVDSQADSGASIRALLDQLKRNKNVSNDGIPCAALGTVEKFISSDLLPVLSAFDIPLVSYYTEDQSLATHAGMLSVSLSVAGRAEAMVRYLQSREYLAIWHTGTDQEKALANAINTSSVDNFQVTVVADNSGVNKNHTLRIVRESGIKTIFLSVGEPANLPAFAQTLEELQMLEPEFLYILPPELVTTDTLDTLYGEQELGSPLDKLLSGALVFDRLDGFRVSPVDDPFLRAWKQQTSEAVDRLNALVPSVSNYLAAPDYFQATEPANGASFLYDAIMTIGLGGCVAVQEGNGGNKTTTEDPSVPQQTELPVVAGLIVAPPRENTTYGKTSATESARLLKLLPVPFGRELLNAADSKPAQGTLLAGMLDTTFQGASGRIAFGKEAGNVRNSEAVAIGFYNIRPSEMDADSGKRSYSAALVSAYSADSGWQDVKGATVVYRDGTTAASDVLREIFQPNFISTDARSIGLVLMAIAWILAIAALLMLRHLAKDGTVLMAQPFFLNILCVGSLLMSTAIFTLSWDEGAGWSDRQLDIACTMTPWFFILGQLTTFCALFTKLWRVDRVLQFRRRAVTVNNVIKPL